MTMPVNVMMTSRHPHDRRARLLRVLAVLLAALMFALTTMVDNVSASGSNTRTIDVNAFSNDAALRRYAIGDTIDAGDTLAAHTGIDKSMADGMYVDDNDGDDDDSGYESSSSTFGNAFAATAAFAEQSTAESKYTGAPTTTTTALDRPRPRGNRRLKIVVLTVGSRGDVQYIIPFCVRLRQLGHRCTVATHEHFRAMITSHGIGFRPVAGDPNEIIKECVESGLFSMQFLLKNGLGEGLRPWMDALYKTARKAVPADTDLLIATPSAMVGYHIAEALRIRMSS